MRFQTRSVSRSLSPAIVLMRMFLDANVLFTATHNPRGKAAFVITLGSEGLFQLSTSAYAREEARRNLER
jgi:hypothetical protein